MPMSGSGTSVFFRDGGGRTAIIDEASEDVSYGGCCGHCAVSAVMSDSVVEVVATCFALLRLLVTRGLICDATLLSVRVDFVLVCLVLSQSEWTSSWSVCYFS